MSHLNSKTPAETLQNQTHKAALHQTAKVNAELVGKAVVEIIQSVASIVKNFGYADAVSIVTINQNRKSFETRYDDLHIGIPAHERIRIGGRTHMQLFKGESKLYLVILVPTSAGRAMKAALPEIPTGIFWILQVSDGEQELLQPIR